MSQVPLSTFCTGRFAPLAEFLKDVTAADWAKMEATDVAHIIPDPKLKMLAAVLHRTLEVEGLFREPVADPFNQAPVKILNLCQAVTSKMFGRSNRTLESTVDKVGDSDLAGVGLIDLRFNNLMDADMDDVVALCGKAARAGSSAFLVDLSGNRMTPDSLDAIADLCAMGQVTFVYVPDIGHTGATAKLASFDARVFAKLIFIRKLHLEANGWHSIVPKAHWARVQRVHGAFYAQFPSFAEYRPA
jgi:hypothetical protein